MKLRPLTAAASETPIPRTSPWVLAILIVLLLGLVGATVKMALYPSPPAAWKSIHEKPNLPVEEVNRLLVESGARIAPVKMKGAGGTETWELARRLGLWSIVVNFKKTPAGLVYGSEVVKWEVANFPSLTRTWEFPVKDKTSAATP
jgi:hypothetical protein